MARPVALLFFTVLSALALAQTPPLAITHVTVIDATGAAPQRDMTVVEVLAELERLARAN